MRQHLISIDPGNQNRLHAIESAIMFISLSDESPSNETELARLAIIGDPRYGWADKGVTHIHRNGLVSLNCDHGPIDAFVTVICTMHMDAELERMSKCFTQVEAGRTAPFEELRFTVDI